MGLFVSVLLELLEKLVFRLPDALFLSPPATSEERLLPKL